MPSKALLVAQRELLENVRTRTFWIGILVFPLILTLAMVVPSWLAATKSAKEYTVVDRSGWLLEAIDARAAMPDLEKVFRTAFARYRGQDPAFAELPESVQQTARQIELGLGLLEARGDLEGELGAGETLEDTVIEGFASMIAGLGGPEGEQLRQLLPGEAVDQLLALRTAIRDWWQALSAEQAEEFGSGMVTKDRYRRLDVAAEGLRGAALIEELNRRVADEELFAYFVIGDDPEAGSQGCKYVSNNLTDDDLRRWFQRLASEAASERRMIAADIDPRIARRVQAPLAFAAVKVAAGGAEEAVGIQDTVRQWAPVAFVYLLWVAVFTIAQMLLTNTIEEKSNRIMEVLLSSLSPLQLMAGKIAGIAATGLTMVTSWIVFFCVMVTFLPDLLGLELGFNLGFIASDPFFLLSFVVYFLLGYLFYAAFLVGIGAVCNSLKEAHNLMAPVSLVLMVPMLLILPVGLDPNGMLARVTSYIPPFTPFVMMNRAAGPPSAFEYLSTTALMVAAIAAALWAAAKVFRIGVLMTGKPPRVMEMLRWLRAPVGAVPERRDPQPRPPDAGADP